MGRAKFKIDNGGSSALDGLVQRTVGADTDGSDDEFEDLSNVINAGGEPLPPDDSASCVTDSTFECPGNDSDFLAMMAAGKCKSEECTLAKAKCEVDPETGAKCMKGNANDPCLG